jgi:Arc/MetJ-type ribon-helix-helix transcriptional regulator
MFTNMATTQVQVRLPKALVKGIDSWVAKGRFASRSEAIKTIIALCNERERIRRFYGMLSSRSNEARENPDELIPLKTVLI